MSVDFSVVFVDEISKSAIEEEEFFVSRGKVEATIRNILVGLASTRRRNTRVIATLYLVLLNNCDHESEEVIRLGCKMCQQMAEWWNQRAEFKVWMIMRQNAEDMLHCQSPLWI